MPDPVPVALLGRLAVDRAWQGKGLGRDLMRDAILRVLAAADIIGLCAILVHAISDEAKRFYERCGFSSSPVDPMTLIMTVAMARTMLASPAAPSQQFSLCDDPHSPTLSSPGLTRRSMLEWAPPVRWRNGSPGQARR